MSEYGGIQGLIEFWSKFQCTDVDRRVHEADLRAGFDPKKFGKKFPEGGKSPVERFLKAEDPRGGGYHLSLTPVPYIGDLKSADIFLLMANPGVNYHDYGEDACPQFQEALKGNLQKDFHGRENQCFALDPHFWWSGWFDYYNRNLRAALCALVEKNLAGNYLDALDKLSRRLAILELVPYYSANGDGIKDLLRLPLPSAEAAREAAQELAQRAEDGKATVIVRWKFREWGLADQVAAGSILSLPHVGLLGEKAIRPILGRFGVS
jgi:hypothetical protein